MLQSFGRAPLLRNIKLHVQYIILVSGPRSVAAVFSRALRNLPTRIHSDSRRLLDSAGALSVPLTLPHNENNCDLALSHGTPAFGREGGY